MSNDTATNPDAMPAVIDAVARWDAGARRVCYFALSEDTWVEINPEEFAAITRGHVRDAVDGICHRAAELMNRMTALLEDLGAFRQHLEKLSDLSRPRPPEGKDN